MTYLRGSEQLVWLDLQHILHEHPNPDLRLPIGKFSA